MMRYYFGLTRLFLLVALCSLSTGALAAEISGDSGNVVKTLERGDQWRYIRGIYVLEKSDRPCWVQVIYNMGVDTVEQCRGKGSGWDRSEPKLILGRVVTGLKVCSSNSGRVKGYTLYGKDDNGNPDTDTFKRRHCKTWRNRVDCPEGQKVTGVELHFDAGRGKKSDALTGIRPLCGTAP